MVDSSVSVHRSAVDDLYRADLRHSTKIIALEIDHHRQLGLLLWVGEEFFRKSLILFHGVTARSRPFDGACLQDVTASAKQQFHRRAQ